MNTFAHCPQTVFLDLSKAFDTLPYDFIMEKLQQHTDETACDLIRDYLSERKQRVTWRGVFIMGNDCERNSPGVLFWPSVV